MQQSDDVRLISEHVLPVKQLQGFPKQGRVPTSAGDGDQRYVRQLAKPELEADLEEKFSAIRTVFGLKRRELSVAEPDEGIGVISAPDFDYEITVGLSEENPSKVIWRRCIVNVKNASSLSSEAFAEVFGGDFSILEVSVPGGLDVEAIIDCVEDAEPDSVKVDYDKDVTWCKITLTDSPTTVRVNANSIRVTSRGETTPAQLIESYLDAQDRFMQSLGIDE